MANALKIHPKDNVVVALCDLEEGIPLELSDSSMDLTVTSQEAIPFGHKVAIANIARGQPVIKYGTSIGVATDDVRPGEHVHVHNLRSVRGAARS